MALSIGTRQNVHVDEQHVSLLAEHMGIAKTQECKFKRYENILSCAEDMILLHFQTRIINKGGKKGSWHLPFGMDTDHSEQTWD